ncbi:MAG: TIGR00725 family protein [Dehalococcoidia bacterium]|nr:TIGR00725 family protein [Dehalococcoidia bacterium]
MATKRPTIIAVIGSGTAPSPQELELAEETGRLLASKGAVVICGGLSGVMESACKGAQSEGGLTIGVLPGNDARTANRYVQIPIVTNLGYARNVIVVKSARAVIAIGGSYGTLSEIAYALDSKIPVIGLHTWSLTRNGYKEKSIIVVKSARSAVQKALKLAEGK